eukprot:6791600-Pyramimonas_sp.AAC.1
MSDHGARDQHHVHREEEQPQLSRRMEMQQNLRQVTSKSHMMILYLCYQPRLRLPPVTKDGEIHQRILNCWENIAKL